MIHADLSYPRAQRCPYPILADSHRLITGQILMSTAPPTKLIKRCSLTFGEN
jgi:hypothetical protein